MFEAPTRLAMEFQLEFYRSVADTVDALQRELSVDFVNPQETKSFDTFSRARWIEIAK